MTGRGSKRCEAGWGAWNVEKCSHPALRLPPTVWYLCGRGRGRGPGQAGGTGRGGAGGPAGAEEADCSQAVQSSLTPHWTGPLPHLVDPVHQV